MNMEIATRYFASRTRFASRNRGRQQQKQLTQGGVAVCGVLGFGWVVIWQMNQDEAPYTHRSRFMMVSRGKYMKAANAVVSNIRVAAGTWTYTITGLRQLLCLSKSHSFLGRGTCTDDHRLTLVAVLSKSYRSFFREGGHGKMHHHRLTQLLC